jgi:hypothetical protein
VYKGLVEAQRIFTDRKEGVEPGIQEAEETEEALDQLVREKSSDPADQMPLGLARTKTGQSAASIEADKSQNFTSAGMIQETRYSNFQLVKKVHSELFNLIVGNEME